MKWNPARNEHGFFCDHCDHTDFRHDVKCQKCPAYIDQKYVEPRVGIAFYGFAATLIALAAASAVYLRHLPL